MKSFVEWRPVQQPPLGRIVGLLVRSRGDGELRVFAAWLSLEEWAEKWYVLVSEGGLTQLRDGWQPIAWCEILKPPKPEAVAKFLTDNNISAG